MILPALSMHASKEVIYNLSRNKHNAIFRPKNLADVLLKQNETPIIFLTLILTQLKS